MIEEAIQNLILNKGGLPKSDDAINNFYLIIVRTINRLLSGEPEILAFCQAILLVNWIKVFLHAYILTTI